MRFLAALLFWLITTAVLAVAVPATWAQHNVVDEDGYAALAAAGGQGSPAAGGDGIRADDADRRTWPPTAATTLNNTESVARRRPPPTPPIPAFPGQFAQANRIAHRWMFTDSVQHDQADGDRWLVDLAPMLADDSLRQTLGNLDLNAPATLTVPMTEPESSSLRPGQLKMLSTWGPWASIGVGSAHRDRRAADACGCPLSRQSPCRPGCFSSSRRGGGLGRAGSRAGATSTTHSTTRPAISARWPTSWSTRRRRACITGST